MLDIKVTGSGRIQRELERMRRGVESLTGSHSVGLSDLFSPAFMAATTRFGTLDELFAAGSLSFADQAAFDACPVGTLDALVSAHTRFTSWEAFRGAAELDRAGRKLAQS